MDGAKMRCAISNCAPINYADSSSAAAFLFVHLLYANLAFRRLNLITCFLALQQRRRQPESQKAAGFVERAQLWSTNCQISSAQAPLTRLAQLICAALLARPSISPIVAIHHSLGLFEPLGRASRLASTLSASARLASFSSLPGRSNYRPGALHFGAISIIRLAPTRIGTLNVHLPIKRRRHLSQAGAFLRFKRTMRVAQTTTKKNNR